MVPVGDSLTYTCRRYGEHALQRVGIWQHHAPQEAQQGVSPGRWILYIHGGAWRDPRRTLDDFVPSMQHLLALRDTCPLAVGGFASIDYRLSPSAAAPQDPAETPASELRSARHPDHILDVRAALGLLAAEHGLGDGYVLVGHSAGATLALQLLMGVAALDAPDKHQRPVPLPGAVIAIAGIYDLAGLDTRHGGAYTGFMSSAFGADREAWRTVSPACFSGSFKDNWPGRGYALLAHSPDDILIDGPEMDAMAAKLAADGVDVCLARDLVGEHDFVWQDGTQVTRLVGQVLGRLQAKHQVNGAS